MENRLEILRKEIDRLIMEKHRRLMETQSEEIRYFICHIYGVSHFCTLLALRRGLNVEIATTCGMLHDIYQVTDGIIENHAAKGAEKTEIILKALNLYNDEEISIITAAISRHSSKDIVNEPYDELLKDADVMHHCLYNTDFPVSEKEIVRYKNLLAEFECNPII
ncbi:MAG: HD domain-containing protein [Oscillospiraceae bacterium]|nr:HD domain-containing protein [Oscillospiraceae bacterium]